MIKLKIENHSMILTEKQWGKIDKYEYFAGEEILPSY